MTRTLGVGIIGCGNISSAYLRLAPLFNFIEVRAVADAVMPAAETRAREFGVRALTVKALLNDPAIDIVVNLTVPAAHFKVSSAVLAAGKHLYSEKPLTLSTREGLALAKLAKARKRVVAGAPDTFLGGAHQRARAALDDGLIGTVHSGSAHILSRGMEHWHPNPDFFFKPGGGPVLDLGPYYIGNLINLIGPVKRVAALSGKAHRRRTIGSGARAGETIPVTTPTTLHALLAFASGALVTLSASWDIVAHHHPAMELYGTEGALFLPDPNFFAGSVSFADSDGAVEPLADDGHPFSIVNERHGGKPQANYRCAGLADMAQAILERRDPRCGLSRILHAVDVMTAIEASGRSGKFVTLKTTCARPRALGPEAAAALLKAPAA